MTVCTVNHLPAATHGETARCLFAIELSKQSWVIGFITPLSAKINRRILMRRPSLSPRPGDRVPDIGCKSRARFATLYRKPLEIRGRETRINVESTKGAADPDLGRVWRIPHRERP
jgi:hypothetical protein